VGSAGNDDTEPGANSSTMPIIWNKERSPVCPHTTDGYLSLSFIHDVTCPRARAESFAFYLIRARTVLTYLARDHLHCEGGPRTTGGARRCG